MPARDYSTPQPPSPSFNRASLETPTESPRGISSRRRMRMQSDTDLYIRLDFNPKHKLIPCSVEYEAEDRSEPSFSSF